MEDMERRIRNLEKAMFGKSGNQWHSRGELEDGSHTGKIGAMTHIVDELGYPMSKGYHSIKIEFPNHRYIGQTGAWTEGFECDTFSVKRG